MAGVVLPRSHVAAPSWGVRLPIWRGLAWTAPVAASLVVAAIAVAGCGGAGTPGRSTTARAPATASAAKSVASFEMLAWGWNDYGALGDHSRSNSRVPVVVSAGAIPRGTRITQVAAGLGTSLALSASGRIFAWGSNLAGDLGIGVLSLDTTSPVAVAVGAIPPGTKISQIAIGRDNAMALSHSAGCTRGVMRWSWANAPPTTRSFRGRCQVAQSRPARGSLRSPQATTSIWRSARPAGSTRGESRSGGLSWASNRPPCTAPRLARWRCPAARSRTAPRSCSSEPGTATAWR